MAVSYCLADSAKDDDIVNEPQEIRQEIRDLLVKRDDEWKTTSAENITKMVR